MNSTYNVLKYHSTHYGLVLLFLFLLFGCKVGHARRVHFQGQHIITRPVVPKLSVSSHGGFGKGGWGLGKREQKGHQN